MTCRWSDRNLPGRVLPQRPGPGSPSSGQGRPAPWAVLRGICAAGVAGPGTAPLPLPPPPPCVSGCHLPAAPPQAPVPRKGSKAVALGSVRAPASRNVVSSGSENSSQSCTGLGVPYLHSTFWDGTACPGPHVTPIRSPTTPHPTEEALLAAGSRTGPAPREARGPGGWLRPLRSLVAVCGRSQPGETSERGLSVRAASVSVDFRLLTFLRAVCPCGLPAPVIFSVVREARGP